MALVLRKRVDSARDESISATIRKAKVVLHRRHRCRLKLSMSGDSPYFRFAQIVLTRK
jgi:hypothetical protein